MSWTERQRRMLGAMGVRLWSPSPSPEAGVSEARVADGARPGATPTPERSSAEAGAATPAAAFEAPASGGASVASAAAATATLGEPSATSTADTAPIARLPVEAPPVLPAPPTLPIVASTPTISPTPTPTPTISPRPVTLASAVAAIASMQDDPALAERAATIATLGWGALKETVAACTACGLCASRTQTVFGVGHARADWMIVGEAPGEQEDLAGEPFVGPAGQLLDQMLRAVGQSRRVASSDTGAPQDDEAGDPRRRVFIANTLKCRPPRNRNPEPDEMARCEPFLKRQVALVQPKVILAMGRFAVKQLLKSDDAIGKLRGRVHRYEGIPVIVSYHPAYLLRNLPDKAKAWEDLCLAKGVSPDAS